MVDDKAKPPAKPANVAMEKNIESEVYGCAGLRSYFRGFEVPPSIPAVSVLLHKT